MSAGKNYLNEKDGLWSWLTTLDHKRIGVMYMITVMLFFLFGGIFAMLIRAELFAPGKTIMEASTYNQVMTLHGAIMVFMVII
ncbi:MAG: cbb3-type cytochrome c oxidase subunit I, partial [Bdellovibrionales bacterium]|nr:cbb3-type cytochrome c oxidase subunit I [Bdellovibrionales bacterium]